MYHLKNLSEEQRGAVETKFCKFLFTLKFAEYDPNYYDHRDIKQSEWNQLNTSYDKQSLEHGPRYDESILAPVYNYLRARVWYPLNPVEPQTHSAFRDNWLGKNGTAQLCQQAQYFAVGLWRGNAAKLRRMPTF